MPSLRWSHCLVLSGLAGLASVLAPLPAGLSPALYQVALVALGAGLALLFEQDSEEATGDEGPAAGPSPAEPPVTAAAAAADGDGEADEAEEWPVQAGTEPEAEPEPEPEPVQPVVEDPQDHFRALVQHATDVIVIADVQGGVSYASPSLHRVLGHDPDRFGGRGVLDLLHPDDEEALGEAVARVLAGGLGAVGERQVRLRHGSGSW